jgi:hypothetical protein
MPRAKATLNTVDLTRALKTAQAAGLSITYTKIGPDGSITIGHSFEQKLSDMTPDEALLRWQEKRHGI